MQLFNFERFYNVLFKNKTQKVLTPCGIRALVTQGRFDTLYPVLHTKALVRPVDLPGGSRSVLGLWEPAWQGDASSAWRSECVHTDRWHTPLNPRTRTLFAAGPASSTAGVSFWGGQNAFPTSGREHELFHTNSCKSSLRKTNYCRLPFKLSRIKYIYFLERFFKLVSLGGDLKTCWNINWKAHFTGR